MIRNCKITKSNSEILKPYIEDTSSVDYKRYGELHPGVNITASRVYSLFPGLVVNVTGSPPNVAVIIEYDANHYISYSTLTTCEVKLGDFVDTGKLIGSVKSFVHVEYMSSISSKWPVRIGSFTMYKNDPTELIEDGYKSIYCKTVQTHVAISNVADDTNPTNYVTDPVEVSVTNGVIKPYILTLYRNISYVDLASAKLVGVCGAIIEAGYLYTSAHKLVDTFKSPRAEDFGDDCVAAKLPYGWLMYARANTTTEAEKEISALSYIVRKYPPQLGVWLSLELTGSRTANDNIINTYKEQLYRLGLKGKIGIYVTRPYLASKITWSSHNKDWLLWIVDKARNVSMLEDKLDGSFFSVRGEFV